MNQNLYGMSTILCRDNIELNKKIKKKLDKELGLVDLAKKLVIVPPPQKDARKLAFEKAYSELQSNISMDIKTPALWASQEPSKSKVPLAPQSRATQARAPQARAPLAQQAPQTRAPQARAPLAQQAPQARVRTPIMTPVKPDEPVVSEKSKEVIKEKIKQRIQSNKCVELPLPICILDDPTSGEDAEEEEEDAEEDAESEVGDDEAGEVVEGDTEGLKVIDEEDELKSLGEIIREEFLNSIPEPLDIAAASTELIAIDDSDSDREFENDFYNLDHITPKNFYSDLGAKAEVSVKTNYLTKVGDVRRLAKELGIHNYDNALDKYGGEFQRGKKTIRPWEHARYLNMIELIEHILINEKDCRNMDNIMRSVICTGLEVVEKLTKGNVKIPFIERTFHTDGISTIYKDISTWNKAEHRDMTNKITGGYKPSGAVSLGIKFALETLSRQPISDLD